ncbi:uroporphyrinogen-III C-methyltransferase [Pseudoalteromonas tunicata]|uniref:Uroporphyrinogen-III synthase HemD (N terminal)/Uroporphyrin-III C-methyltransferase (C terminal) n=1 Tax=Pseudoalteromonas tunicata D2 TaxID=87626 RepID=A4CFD4_9GAMM|nr:uroporphyrinogen-III C-methyltransferase [Pseudoalteromonas tunicata]ATC92932.1 uroporphyrinogen III methyltransferase / synthase [Pseudoalteromonas tunicata]AXT32031.1 uroporphyrinogen-III synthase [Pseudoalteromonas tunicata]EAR26572.1 uroporphyrinogen-III synthase HemD (N terminal)/Uroporphyrin-III C-methyltransferase (C terminal) [Pseudoalteromonas tunicata D2]MDP4985222.1 uroporphyrinogen-III synthase [Pseudoalteromonas tunicata]
MAVILVTRPDTKGAELVAQLKKLGHHAISFPLLALEPLAVSSAALAPLGEADKLIFISQDAVKALYALKPNLKHQPQFFAVGEKTAAVIAELFGVKARIAKPQDSEGLLALKELQHIEQQNIVLLKGQDGRPLIAQKLKQRGAFVHAVVLYRRQPVKGVASGWIKQWQQQKIDSIVLTSNAAVDAIFRELAENEVKWLKTCRFYVASERIANYLSQFAIAANNIQICAGASDEAILTAISQQDTTMTDEKETQNNAQDATPVIEVKTESAVKNVSAKDKPSQKSTPSSSGRVFAAVAILIALGVGAGAGFGYLQQQQYSNQLFSQLNNEKELLAQQVAQLQNMMQQQLELQRTALNQTERNVKVALESSEQLVQQQLSQTLEQKSQQTIELNINEAKSMQRLAVFKVQSEQNYSAAAAIFKQLDGLLAQYPNTEALRAAVNQDLQSVLALPVAPVDELYFTLYGLTKQLSKLPLNMVQLPDAVSDEQQQGLTENVSDWQQNLKRSWQILVDDFIKIRERSAPIEPLLSPSEQVLVRQQLAFYFAQAQTALLNKQAQVFATSLIQAQQVLSDFYDGSSPAVISLTEQLVTLRQTPLQFNPAVEFVSGAAFEEWSL